MRWLQGLCGGQPGHLQEIRRALRRARRQFTAIEGQSRSRNVVIEFPDYETALACYHSPEYQENIKVRLPHSTPISSSSKAMTARSPEGP
jgi:hypothetical protein